MPASKSHRANTAPPKRTYGWGIAFILASALLTAPLCAIDPPPDLVKRVAAKEAENEYFRNNYTYRETVVVEELDDRGLTVGYYRAVRDVLFDSKGLRTEQPIGHPTNTLRRMRLTPEDYQDLRLIQPLLLTAPRLWLYETQYKGEEEIDGKNCFVLQVKPRQILDGQRLFQGLLWIDPASDSIVRSEGQAVPEVRTTKTENLFPHFTTIRTLVDGRHWFPLKTYGEDTLHFRSGPQRMRLTIRYSDYKKFSSDTTITFPTQP